MVSHPVIAKYRITRARSNTSDGYIRVRATLINGDFLEAAEYFVINDGKIVTSDYHHQWMDHNKKILRRRWDSTPHFPSLDNFPHHVHIGDEANVHPGRVMNLLDLLNVLKNELLE